MDTLDALEQNVQALLQRYDALLEENRQLRRANEEQRGEILRTHSELLTSQKECTRLKTALAITGSPETRKDAYQRLTKMITRIDDAMEVLKN